MVTRILLTGFEPFGTDSRNPSLEAVRIVEKQFTDPAIELHVRPLKVEFAGAHKQLNDYITQISPDVVICVGLAAGRPDITFERVAINIADARIPDNSGAQPIDVALEDQGAPAHFSTLPVKSMVEAVRAHEIPASLSNTAGTYVCNAAMYYALSALDGTAARAGFVHVPDVFGTNPPMELNDTAQALQIALKVAAHTTTDSAVSMGREF
jgi:pyroglutamyl-peptidase